MKNELKNTKSLTASDLKFYHELKNPESPFFSRDTMKFFGDTISNFGCSKVIVETTEGIEVIVYSLYRKRPAKCGLGNPTFFDTETFQVRHDIKGA